MMQNEDQEKELQALRDKYDSRLRELESYARATNMSAEGVAARAFLIGQDYQKDLALLIQKWGG